MVRATDTHAKIVSDAERVMRVIFTLFLASDCFASAPFHLSHDFGCIVISIVTNYLATLCVMRTHGFAFANHWSHSSRVPAEGSPESRTLVSPGPILWAVVVSKQPGHHATITIISARSAIAIIEPASTTSISQNGVGFRFMC
jgi:hypothetical protein